eukprot:COSAG02_NODE_3123_length_7322_cov_42.435553_1_plen_250_part_00
MRGTFCRYAPAARAALEKMTRDTVPVKYRSHPEIAINVGNISGVIFRRNPGSGVHQLSIISERFPSKNWLDWSGLYGQRMPTAPVDKEMFRGAAVLGRSRRRVGCLGLLGAGASTVRCVAAGGAGGAGGARGEGLRGIVTGLGGRRTRGEGGMGKLVGSVDQGTSSTRFILFDEVRVAGGTARLCYEVEVGWKDPLRYCGRVLGAAAAAAALMMTTMLLPHLLLRPLSYCAPAQLLRAGLPRAVLYCAC